MPIASKKPPVLKGKVVTLRPIDVAKDAPAWFEEMRDADLWRWTDDVQPKSMEDLKKVWKGWLENPELVVWAIEDNETRRIVGTVRVEPREDEGRVIIADQTNQIARSVWRRGHHREACQLVFDWAFKTVAADEIRTKAWAPNDNAWRSMEALGFQRIREAHYMNNTVGVPMPMRHYVLTKKTWMGQQKRAGVKR
ncbi:MAG: GNAT family N-acetyltransferase [Planctomycetia bacterium]|nr:GNAT family N-acetyltransferase [Planctomycetia bacterium]